MLKTLHTVLNRLVGLAPGDYLLRHIPSFDRLLLYRSQLSATGFDLHAQLAQAGSIGTVDFDYVPACWVPGGRDQIPDTFVPAAPAGSTASVSHPATAAAGPAPAANATSTAGGATIKYCFQFANTGSCDKGNEVCQPAVSFELRPG